MGFFDLFEPAWNSKNPKKRKQAVAALKMDTEKRIEKMLSVAKKTQYADTRQEAYVRLALEAKGLTYFKIRKEAVEKIENEITLAQVAVQSWEPNIRDLALEKITSPQAFEKIAMSEIEGLAEASRYYHTTIKTNPQIAQGSKILTEEEFLKKTKRELNPHTREKAITKVDNPAVLANVATQDSSEKVRALAVEKIEDQDLLQNVAQKDTSENVRCVALSKIKNQSFLKDVAGNDTSLHIRYAAITNITDQNFLKEIALTDTVKTVCNRAIQNISDQKILCELIQIEATKKNAAEKLLSVFCEREDQDILAESVPYIIQNMSSGAGESEPVRKKLLQLAKSNPSILKPFFPALREKYSAWHSDRSHYDTQHTDEQGYSRSGDCTHTDEKTHTDKKHADTHLGKEYLAQFPPYFNE